MKRRDSSHSKKPRSAGRTSGPARRKFVLWYTILYVLLFGAILVMFHVQGRSLVYHSDAWRQHIRALAYYGKWLRGILYNIFVEHTLEIPAWSFGLGYGGDVLTTLQYYCIGEPLTALSVFVPEKYTWILFQALMVVRPYLAGLAFYAYAEYLLKGRYGQPASGDVPIRPASGDVPIRPASGDVPIRPASDDGSYRPASADASPRPASADASYRAASGDVPLRSVSDDSSLRSTSGCAVPRSSSDTAACKEERPSRFLLPVLSGALCYAFCGTVLYIGMLHPYFVTPMIWFPLLLLGIERMLRERRPAVLMVITCLSGLSNFYYCYILMLLSALYALFRVFFTMSRRNGMRGAAMWKERVLTLLRMLGAVLAGLAGAGCILIPILIQYGSNPRGSISYEVSLFYDADYYSELLENLVSFINHPQYDVELCMAMTAVAALMILFLIRGHRQLKTAVIGCIGMLCFPVFGWAMNGFSYVIDRWTFAAELLISLILVLVWCDAQMGRCRFVLRGRKGDAAPVDGSSVSEYRLSRSNRRESECADDFPEHSPARNSLRRAAACADASEAVEVGLANRTDGLSPKPPAAHPRLWSWLNPLLVVMTVVSISLHLWDAFAPGGFASEFVKEQSPEEYAESAASNEATVAAGLGEEGEFYRYTGHSLTWNAALNSGTSSTQFCWSLANGRISEFFEAIGNRDEQNFAYYALDDRIILNALAGVKYYLLPEWSGDYENTHAMYGYVDLGVVKLEDYLKSQEDSGDDAAAEEVKDSWESSVTSWHVYENAFALPLGYTYTNVMTESEFYSLSMTERQEALLQSVIVSDETAGDLLASEELDGAAAEDLNYYEEAMAFAVSCGEGVSVSAAGEAENNASGVRSGNSNEANGNASGAAAEEESPDANTEENAGGTDSLNQNSTDTDPADSDETEQNGSDSGSSVSDAQVISAQSGLTNVVFHVTRAGAQVTISFEGLENAETYLSLTGLAVSGNEYADTLELYTIGIQGYSGDYEMSDKDLSFHTASSQYYSGWTDYAVNVGYSGAAKTSIVITFPSAGDYTVEELRIICQPIEEAMSEVAMRLAGALDDADLGLNPISNSTNEITGTVTMDRTRFLLLNIPYSEGWTAYVDGEKVELEKANIMYMGFSISAGEHEIRLVYHTPGLSAGWAVSILGIATMIFLAWRSRKVRC